ncbi:MAG: hypothetical protein WKF92_06885 [Pyrinomonadaceae bacterium]
MKRFLSAVVFCSFLLIGGAFLIATSSTAKEDIVLALMNFPAPPPPNPLVQGDRRSRNEEFFNKTNPPADDAPIEDLLEYWITQNGNYVELGYNPKPSATTLGRLLDEIRKNPETVSGFLNVLRDSPEAAEAVKRIYDTMDASAEMDDDSRSGLKRWLKFNSPHFSNELARDAQKAGDVGEYVGNQEELLALAKVDFRLASPMINRLYNDSSQKTSQVLARWALYKHALDEGSVADTDRYRDELKAVVEDKNATAGMRDLAFDALSKENEWPGREEWYYSLLGDETLADLRVNGQSYTGLTTLMLYAPEDRYLDKMIEFASSDNLVIRAAAVRNLITKLNGKNPAVVKVMLPWLEDANWAKDTGGGRNALVQALATVKLPESVPGLIAALNEKGTRDVYVRDGNANSMSNMNPTVYSSNMAIITNSNMNRGSGTYRTTKVTYYPLRSAAIGALANQADMRAAPALRRILPEVESYEGSLVVRAILLCNGYTVAEQADALEAVARAAIKQSEPGAANSMMSNRLPYRMSNAMANAANYSAINDSGDEDAEEVPVMPSPNYNGSRSDDYPTDTNYPMMASNMMRPGQFSINEGDMKQVLGGHLLQIKDAGEPLVREVIERIVMFEKRDPPMSEMLRGMLLNWNGTAINALMLRDLKNNRSDAHSILKLLSVRKEIREKQVNDVYDMRTGNAIAFGISACLLEDDAGYAGILNGENAQAKTAMLACARLIRAKLPVKEVAKFVSAIDKRLALAAEGYLESEDSPEARVIVLALHPNEAKIMGARAAFFGNDSSRHAAPNPFISALFASVNASFDIGWYEYAMYNGRGDFRTVEKSLQDEVRTSNELLGVYSYDNNVIRIYKDKALYSWDEDLSRYRDITLSKEAFDDFKSYLTFHRVDEMAPFLGCFDECVPQQLLMLGKQGGRRVFVNSSRRPEFVAGIEKIFEDLKRGPAKLRYKLEKDVPGLEILFADENLTAETVWKNGGDFRLLVSDKARRKKIEREIEQENESAQDGELDDEGYGRSEQKAWKLRQLRQYDNFTWLNFGGSLTDAAAQPEGVEFIPLRDSFIVQPASGQWKAKTGNIEVRVDSEGLYKIGSGKFTRIREGHYDSPVITANGRWAVATKYNDEAGPKLFRVNLLTNREFPVAAGENSIGKAVAFVPATGKMLVTSPYYNDYEDQEYGEGETYSGPYFWLDPETGAVVPAKGEIKPIAQQKFRSLQPASSAFEFWAAIPNQRKNETNVGIYNAKTLVFKTVMKIPKISFDSMNMWVDETAGKVYFVYSGHLLALPLKK